MSYRSIEEMASSQSLIGRIAACVSTQPGTPTSPLGWARENIWTLVSTPEWDDAWDYATGASTINVNPDTGARDDVVSDAMILAAVQSLLTPPSE